MITATSTDRIGSIGIQPVAKMTTAAASAATEPSRSPATCSTAALTLRFSRSPPCSTLKATMLTARPASATQNMVPPSTTVGSASRCQASATIQPAMANRVNPLAKATSTANRS